MIQKIKEWFEKKQYEKGMMDRGRMMYHKKEQIIGTEDLLILKGYYDEERKELKSIQRLKRLQDTNRIMKLNNGKKVSMSDNPFNVKLKPLPKQKMPKDVNVKW